MKEHLYLAYDLTYTKSQKLYRHLRKYGWDNFVKIILTSNLTHDDAKKIEIRYISHYNTFEKGLNSTSGGDGAASGRDNHRAKAVKIYNNKTREITSFDWLGGCACYLGINYGLVSQVAGSYHTAVQTYSSKLDAFFQIKYINDNTPFVENMPTPYEKHLGSNNYYSKSVKVYNNKTKEILIFGCEKDASIFYKISQSMISAVLTNVKTASQTFSSKYNTWLQIKYTSDEIPFIENMPKPSEKKYGEKNHMARAILLYNNTTTEKTIFACIQDAAKFLGVGSSSIKMIFSSTNSSTQVFSDNKNAWFQARYVGDDTPFVVNMKTHGEKARKNVSKPMFIFGNMYESANKASEELRLIFKRKGNFVAGTWIYRNMFSDVFYISKEMYEHIKDNNEVFTF
jgi:hypothetical protein